MATRSQKYTHQPAAKPIPCADDLSFLPPHEPTPVAGFHAYARQMGVAPGESIELCVSHDGPVDVRIERYGPEDRKGVTLATLSAVESELEPIHRGSYVHVARPIGRWPEFSVEVWFRTLADAPLAGLVSQNTFTLSLRQGNVPCFGVRTDKCWHEFSGSSLSLKEWHHLVATCDGKLIHLHIDGKPVREPMPLFGAVDWKSPAKEPLRLAALGDALGQASAFFTGDLCGPAVYPYVLKPALIASRWKKRETDPAPRAVAHWKFDAIGGKPYRDATGTRHGKPVNYPIRMVPGPQRIDDDDWCTYNPLKDHRYGHAARFMADALVDCRWPIAARWRVPASARSGQYVARVTNAAGEIRHVHFIVRPKKPTARLACLSTTNTRVAYNFDPFANDKLDYGAYRVHPSYPVLGQILGVRRPSTGEPWQRTTVFFETPFYAWLEREGIAYDLYTEWDLEADPSLLDDYDVVAWAGHSEYWSVKQYEALRAFVARGGHIACFSGNTAFWRVSVDLKNSAIEVRKHDRRPCPGTTCDPMVHRAHWHQMDHLPGTYMHTSGWPQTSLIGSVTTGFTNPPLQGPRASYEVTAADHPLFHSPRPIDTAGPFALNGAGYETDVSARSMLKLYGESKIKPYPARDRSRVPRLADPFDKGLTVLARAKIPNSNVLDYDVNFSPSGELWGEMTIIERPDLKGHGLVFTSGSVLSSEALLTDANFSDFAKNVLNRMGLDVPLSNGQ
ncbi:MAG: hypothetical protein K8S99_08240 [Planctomycetes bacterium]|nr:hypothetical protein [Planctomycetota bacterium]